MFILMDEIKNNNLSNIEKVCQVNNKEDLDDVFKEDKNINSNSPLFKNIDSLSPNIIDACPVIPRKSSLIKERPSAQNQPKKTVSFSYAPLDRPIISAKDCLLHLKEGTELIKLRSNNKRYNRLYFLTQDFKEIRWKPSNKKPEKAKVNITDIKEVRIGLPHSHSSSASENNLSDSQCFSIIFGDNFENLDLASATSDDTNVWVTGLNYLIKNKNISNLTGEISQSTEHYSSNLRDRWLEECFCSINEMSCGEVEEMEIIRLIKQLNPNLSMPQVQVRLKEILMTKLGKNNRITSSEFKSFYKNISTRPEIYFLFARYSSSAEYLTLSELLIFLENEQQIIDVNHDICEDIIKKFEPTEEGRRLLYLSIDGFTNYLNSIECDIFDRRELKVCQNMDFPLTHYFISASHNTYMVKDQLKGPSSIESYIAILQKGCRYVEMDCWDGLNNEPVIYNGYALTSKISFRSVIEAINDHAFLTSPYPLFVSINNHCCIEQQLTMVSLMQEILGKKIEISPFIDTNIPSPESLKFKIIILSKKLSDECTDGSEVSEDDDNIDSEQQRKHSLKRQCSLKRIPLSRQFSDMVRLFRSKKFTTLQSYNKARSDEILLLNETTVIRIANSNANDLVGLNKRVLTRTRPNCMRVDSSNYNPQDMWNCGCQLVTMNYQTSGPMMDLYEGRFLINGGCGYVLKPQIMCDEMAHFTIDSKSTNIAQKILYLKLISAQRLPRPHGAISKGVTIDPFIVVEIFGVPSDCREMRTKTIHNISTEVASPGPVFDESFEFLLSMPELAMLRITAIDDEALGDSFIGQFSLPINTALPGYRHVQLKDNAGELIEGCKVFLRIIFDDKKDSLKRSKRESILRRKSSSSQISFKTVSLKQFDDNFKNINSHITEASELMSKVNETYLEWMTSIGLTSLSTPTKQAIRKTIARIQSTSTDTQIQLYIKQMLYPKLHVVGVISDTVKRSLTAFEEYVTSCKALLTKTDDLLFKMETGRDECSSLNEEFDNLNLQNSLKGKKLEKAMENYSWNMRTLKGHVDLLEKSKDKCQESLRQILETGRFLGIVTKDDSSLDKTQLDLHTSENINDNVDTDDKSINSIKEQIFIPSSNPAFNSKSHTSCAISGNVSSDILISADEPSKNCQNDKTEPISNLSTLNIQTNNISSSLYPANNIDYNRLEINRNSIDNLSIEKDFKILTSASSVLDNTNISINISDTSINIDTCNKSNVHIPVAIEQSKDRELPNSQIDADINSSPRRCFESNS